FELGKSYNTDGDWYAEKQLLSLAIAGKNEPEQWNTKSDAVSFYNIKSAVDAIIKRLKIEGIRVEDYEGTYFDFGLTYRKGEKALVSFGAVAKANLKKADVDGAVFFAQFDWDLLLKVIKKNKITYKEVSKFPSVRRDLALLLDEAVSFEQLRLIANRTEKKLLKEVGIFDVYKGDKLPEGKKSYALSFVLQDEDKTLTDKQIDGIIQKLIINFEKEAGASGRQCTVKCDTYMASLSSPIDIIREKTKNLIQLCGALQEENDLLKLEVQSLQVAFDTSSDKVKQLEDKVKALAVAKTLDNSEIDKDAINEKVLDTKRKINDFVREIDKCISLLK